MCNQSTAINHQPNQPFSYINTLVFNQRKYLSLIERVEKVERLNKVDRPAIHTEYHRLNPRLSLSMGKAAPHA